jgi:hypothetical protein
LVRAPFLAAIRFLLLRSHHRPSSNRGPSASTLKSPAHRPALERAARKTSRPHVSLWRVPAARRAMPWRHQPRPTHRGCPGRRRGLGHSNGRRDTGVASTRSPVPPHTASHERAPAARTCMWGRVRHARRFRNASCERPRMPHGCAGESGKKRVDLHSRCTKEDLSSTSKVTGTHPTLRSGHRGAPFLDVS